MECHVSSHIAEEDRVRVTSTSVFHDVLLFVDVRRGFETDENIGPEYKLVLTRNENY
jgi:hypothetical protein